VHDGYGAHGWPALRHVRSIEENLVASLIHSAAVDRSSPVPAYHQLARALKARIDHGDWQPSERLPTEVELSQEYGLSRATVRQALSELARDAYVSREQGKGTFVLKTPTPLLHDLSLPVGLAHRSRTQGFVLDSRVIRLERTTRLVPSIAEQLGLTAAAPVVELERVMSINGVPSALSLSWLPESLVPDLATAGLIDGSVSTTLRDRYGLLAARYDNLLEVRSADPRQASLLSIAADAPLILLTATSFTAADSPLEASWTYWRSDRVRFRFGVTAELLPGGVHPGQDGVPAG
jgi:DNA-binding GntR family transcriptional regulator